MSEYPSVKRLRNGPTHYSITDLCARLPSGTTPLILWQARRTGAMPDPDVQLSIVTPWRSQAVPAWEVARIRPWLDLVERNTRGYALRYRHLKFLAVDRQPWWNLATVHLATTADMRAVCPTSTKETIRYRLRAPGAWWHEEAVNVGNRTGWTLATTRRIIDDLALPLDLSRWEWLTALTDSNLSTGRRTGLLAALAADPEHGDGARPTGPAPSID